jgi:5-deoxy-glucuronate isomerase
MTILHHRAGSLATASTFDSLTPETAQWTYCGLDVLALKPGEAHVFASNGRELFVVPMQGGLRVEVEHKTLNLDGRDSVFARVTDTAYIGLDSEARLTSDHGAVVAIASARATKRFDSVYLPAENVPVEARGAGPATRQLNNFGAPDVFDGADKIMVVEVLTPDGNWSSYPPHRHDGETDPDGTPCVVNNEEIYYFRIGRTGTTAYAPDGFGMHRTYTADGTIDENVVVRDGDIFVVPRGYHGPCIAAPGYPMYYLNVLAGPAGERSMAFCDDPKHHWVRSTWDDMPIDPRIPMTGITSMKGPA